ELSEEQVACAAGLEVSEYCKYEEATVDFSFSALHNIAKALGVDLTDLLTGESAKLNHYILTRAGCGHSVERSDDYDYKHLAMKFQNRLIEPFMVTLTEDNNDVTRAVNSHAGQEFDYVVSGRLKVVLDGTELILDEGDSLFYNSALPHAMIALSGKPAKFLAVVTE
ncbi:MAG: XRE family transcriptional regulator, partial [Clostridia bacterium]